MRWLIAAPAVVFVSHDDHVGLHAVRCASRRRIATSLRPRRQIAAKSCTGSIAAHATSTTLKGKCAAEELSSAAYVCGATGNAPPLVGASFMKRFHSVGDLYSRVKWTMPAPPTE